MHKSLEAGCKEVLTQRWARGELIECPDYPYVYVGINGSTSGESRGR